MPRWIAVDEVGNDNFATSIYEDDFKGLLICRCNQNGQYPWQASAIIFGLEQNRAQEGYENALKAAPVGVAN